MLLPGYLPYAVLNLSHQIRERQRQPRLETTLALPNRAVTSQLQIAFLQETNPSKLIAGSRADPEADGANPRHV